jgi:MerR family mercuric resistance operon transcriptional regulator
MSDDNSSGNTLTSGQLARLAGVSADSLRYYERCGLLPKAVRSSSGYRHFDRQALPRVRMIKAALSIGFTVEELARIFRARDSGAAPCEQVRELAQQKLTSIEERILELTRMRAQLKSTLTEWNKTLRRTGKGQRAGLLESFAAAHPEAVRSPSPLLSPPLRRKFSNSRSNFPR